MASLERLCRGPGCGKLLSAAASNRGPRRFYCSTHWNELKAYLLAAVDQIYPEARTLYLGRSNYPERRLLEHRVRRDRPQMAILHWTSDWAEIAFLEEWLIGHYQSARKSVNKVKESAGKWRGPWNCLYLSWAWKNEASRLPSSDVEFLNDGLRIAPDTTWPGTTQLISCRLEVDEARAALEHLSACRAAWSPTSQATRRKKRRSARRGRS